jgi:hypothetical protein
VGPLISIADAGLGFVCRRNFVRVRTTASSAIGLSPAAPLAFSIPANQNVPARALARFTYSKIANPRGSSRPIATGVAGAVIGALAAAGYVAARTLDALPDDDEERHN